MSESLLEEGTVTGIAKTVTGISDPHPHPINGEKSITCSTRTRFCDAVCKQFVFLC